MERKAATPAGKRSDETPQERSDEEAHRFARGKRPPIVKYATFQIFNADHIE